MALKRRGLTNIVMLIDRLQVAEKDKLTLTASNHLDRMHTHLPTLYSQESSSQAVKLVSDPAISKRRLDELQILITSITEEIQLEKFDFFETEDNFDDNNSISSL